MKQILLFACLCGVLTACEKNKFETVPQVTIKSFGPDVVRKGELFELVAEVTDKEGDLQDSVLLLRKRFTNGTIPVPTRNDDSTYLDLRDFRFPNKPSIELRILFAYGEQIPGTFFYNIQESVDRGVTYTLIVSDRAKNKSKSVETRMITLKKV